MPLLDVFSLYQGVIYRQGQTQARKMLYVLHLDHLKISAVICASEGLSLIPAGGRSGVPKSQINITKSRLPQKQQVAALGVENDSEVLSA
jgi:hypothetical protein